MALISDHLAPDRSGNSRASDIIEWLTGDASHALDDAGLLAGLGERLIAIGLPLARVTLHLRTLHPELVGRTLAWAPGEPVEVVDRQHGIENAAVFTESPVRQVMDSGKPLTVRLDQTGTGQPLLEVFRDRDLGELVIRPLRWGEGRDGAVVFATARRERFTSLERQLLNRIVPTLRTVCELRLLRQTEAVLLDTYVGTATGRRILAGHIKRNEVESLEAALLLCDMRGFTELSNRLAGQRMLALLNDYFDCVVPAITDCGGEILKFMGDAVLAFFANHSSSTACKAAYCAAGAILAGVAMRSATEAIRVGIALHHGIVSYGNIGSGRRLDFTVIGPDVNLLSRIERVCSRSGSAVLMSSKFAGLLGSAAVSPAGRYRLKGFTGRVDLYACSFEDAYQCLHISKTMP
jgi:adenylate cyclase